MGKKRRLNAAKAKFNVKHGAHPRMKFLAQTTQAPEPETEIVEETATLEKPPEVETASVSVSSVNLTPKKTTTATKVPATKTTVAKAKKSTTTRKKSTTSTRKRTVKKKTNNTSA
tara:strand:+ start:174 stop:518 length:345 start_codon:yes stop_codon:yes gene_type:complete